MTKYIVLAVSALSMLAVTAAEAQSTKCKPGETLVNGKCVQKPRGS